MPFGAYRGLVLALTVCVVTMACAPSPVTTRYEQDPAQRLTSLVELDRRVARVSRALLEANADLCPVVRLSAGWALHAASQYSRELQPHVAARFGLDGDLPGILSVPEGSASLAAGLSEGDVILTVNGLSLDRGPDRREPSFNGIAANIAMLDRALATGLTRIAVKRFGDDRVIEIDVTPHRACGYEVQLNPSADLNARADGRRLFITTALAGFTETDDELAIILGHELAHHVLRHRHWSDVGGAGRHENETFVVSEGTQEQQADRVGLLLSARAGFNTSVAASFWRRFGAFDWRVRFPQMLHDSAEARARSAERVQAEIDDKLARREPLLP